MKISISYPPLKSNKGTPLLTQNRQFQWFNSATYIFPVIPAYAATLLSKNGHQVFWHDGIAKEQTYQEWLSDIINTKPDLLVMESKTPVIKQHWSIINELKSQIPNPKSQTNFKLQIPNYKPIIVLVGDHVTALPEESLKNSKVDFVLTGGDFDFLLLNLVNHLTKGEKLEPGIYWRKNNCHLEPQREIPSNYQKNNGISRYARNDDFKIVNSGKYSLSHNLDSLPIIDRKLVNWQLYAYENGNFKHTPGTYMMSGRDCWHGKCTFCSWTTLFPGSHFRARSAKLALDEVGELIKLGVKEIMEDSGSLPIGNWLQEFCQGMIERGYNKKVVMSCNMRINGIKDPKIWQLMKQAGFRFILFGLESANQKTLDRIQKNLKISEIEPGLKMCKQAGLEPHITAMIGYPWETKQDAQKTVCLAKDLFKKGYVDTLQATIVIPYPGTPLYKYCLENNILNFTDYDRFDQREQVMKSILTTGDVKELTSGLYKAFMTPKFILKKILSVRSKDDLAFLWKAGTKLMGHLMDFKK